MYERMLNQQVMPAVNEMTVYCGDNAELFAMLNEWLTETYETEQQVSFPYGNSYGWGIAHRKKKKLLCHVFAENNAFTVMMRLTDKQYESTYERLQEYTQRYIDNKYPCGDGGWIHYRVTCKDHFDDIRALLAIKCS